MADQLVLPRPGATFEPRDPIPGPSESSFTSTFGALLPPAKYITLPQGRAAYYFFPAADTASSPSISAPPSIIPDTVPKKVLLIHGVQTPALGLLPLITELRAAFPRTQFAACDLWGHGLSDTPFAPHEGTLFHALIDAVLRELGWKGSSEPLAGGVGLVGYSFGAVLTMGYLSEYLNEGERRRFVDSFVLVAPAGLVRRVWFNEQEKVWLSPSCPPEHEAQAAQFVVETLEGSSLPIAVPSDWQQKVSKGEIVAQAVKDWEMRNHPGHPASVVGVFRDGSVIDNDQLFVDARKLGLSALVVLGENDGLSSEEEIEEFGFDVKVVKGAGHAVVRENAGEVAECIGRFWKGGEGR